MSDRTSAEIFAMVFDHLAKNPDTRNKDFALKMWKASYQYDFSHQQLECDGALVKLGLCKKLPCGCTLYEGQTHEEGYC